MTFSNALQTKLSNYDLLTHQLYQYWNEGKLSPTTLLQYAKEYYHHVESFPRALSAIHSLCNDRAERKIILENLLEEEFNEPTHPQLWLNFARALNLSEEEINNSTLHDNTKALLCTFQECCRASYEEGIGALYAHEYQYSKIAQTKKEGLQKFYNIDSKEALEFFTVHADVDVWHGEQLTTLLDKLPQDKHHLVEKGAIKAARALWGFLDGMLEYQHA
jgi:pyrroloquinoline-quinone synthase